MIDSHLIQSGAEDTSSCPALLFLESPSVNGRCEQLINHMITEKPHVGRCKYIH